MAGSSLRGLLRRRLAGRPYWELWEPRRLPAAAPMWPSHANVWRLRQIPGFPDPTFDLLTSPPGPDNARIFCVLVKSSGKKIKHRSTEKCPKKKSFRRKDNISILENLETSLKDETFQIAGVYLRGQVQTGRRTSAGTTALLTHLEHLPALPSRLGEGPVQLVHVHRDVRGALRRLKILRKETRSSAACAGSGALGGGDVPSGPRSAASPTFSPPPHSVYARQCVKG